MKRYRVAERIKVAPAAIALFLLSVLCASWGVFLLYAALNATDGKPGDVVYGLGFMWIALWLLIAGLRLLGRSAVQMRVAEDGTVQFVSLAGLLIPPLRQTLDAAEIYSIEKIRVWLGFDYFRIEYRGGLEVRIYKGSDYDVLVRNLKALQPDLKLR